MKKIQLTAKIDVNHIGFGGHIFYTTNKDKIQHLSAWIFDMNNNPLSSWVLINYPESGKFEPGRAYITDITLMVSDDTYSFFKQGNKFEIQVGRLYDNKRWAIGKIIDIKDAKKST